MTVALDGEIAPQGSCRPAFCYYNNTDGHRVRPEKSAKNDRERGLPFERTAELEWDKAYTVPDQRRDYGEERFVAFAPLRGRLYAVCFGERGNAFRIISFRKANRREEKAYEQATTDR